MLDLQDITIQYLSQKFQPELLSVVLDACTLLHQFGLTQYENDLVEMVSGEHDLDTMDLRDRFTNRVGLEMLRLLQEHFVSIDSDADVTLQELVQLGSFLLLIQNLEDPSAMAYRVYGTGSGRSVFVDLMGIYSPLPRHRALELVSQVDDRLIQAFRDLVGDRQENVAQDAAAMSRWRDFCVFTDSAPSLAQTLHSQGYFGVSVQEMVALSRLDIAEHLRASFQKGREQASLDALGLLYLCKDTCADPMASFTPALSFLVDDPDTVNRMQITASAMHRDFCNWLEARRAGILAGKEIVG